MEKQGHLIGPLIQERRRKREMTIGELARASTVTASEMTGYEAGECVPDAAILSRMAGALAVEPAYFWDHDIVYTDEGSEVHPADALTVTRLSDTELETLLLVQWHALSRNRRNLAACQMRVLGADQQRTDFPRILDGIV